MRNRHRWLYYQTGLPGWMRYGFSPGWVDRSPTGLGPGAQYLTYGTWPTPQMNYAWQQGQIPYHPMPGFPQPGFPAFYDPWGPAELTPEQEVNLLKAEAELLDDELSGLEQRIKELEGKK